jgi:hypothetical protein
MEKLHLGSGSDWHATIRNDQNHCTQGDLPRFIRHFYEECRGPPRLFLLDKYVYPFVAMYSQLFQTMIIKVLFLSTKVWSVV